MLNSGDFYSNYYGHKVTDLEVLLSGLKEFASRYLKFYIGSHSIIIIFIYFIGPRMGSLELFIS